MNSTFSFQQIAAPKVLSAEVREAISNNVLQFYVRDQQQGTQDEGITALYERLSQEDKLEGESNSIANQKKILERYCREHGYTAIRHYDEDDGYSGTNFNRPGFQRMLADIKAGKIKRVIVKDMSRFGRDYLQVGFYTDILFPDFGVHFIAVNDGVDSTRGENEFTAIRNVFNEMYARDTSKKIRATWQSKGKSGEHLTTIPPYGYMKDPDNKKKWIIDEEAAAVVQQIFALCVSGLGPQKIGKWLEEHQILNPTFYWLSKGLKVTNKPKPEANPYKWTNETVSRILERLDYLGHTVNFKTSKQSFKSKKVLWNDPADWVIFENTQEPIIEESVFLIVQKIRQGRRRPTKMGDMGMFSGLLFCADCGGKMTIRRRKDDRRKDAFICSTYRKKKKNLCTEHAIKVNALEQIVLADIRKVCAYVRQYEEEFVEDFRQCSAKESARLQSSARNELKKTENRLSEIEKIIVKLYEEKVCGTMPEERFELLAKNYETEQTELKEKVIRVKSSLTVAEENDSSIAKFISLVRSYTEVNELTPEILNSFIDKIYIGKPERIDGQRVQQVKIVYKLVGAVNIPQ